MTPIKKAKSEAQFTSKLPVTKVTDEMREAVHQISIEDSVSMGDVIREAVEMLLARRRREKKAANPSQDS